MGNMDMGQMQGMHRAHQKPDAGKLTNDVFAKLDPTGQGSIDAQSFLAALGSQTAQPVNGATSSPAISENDASQFFTAMDGNSDGKVTPEEMNAMFAKVSEQFQTRMQMQQQAGTDLTAQQGVQGHRHQHGHKQQDALNDSDALMQAVNAAQAGTTPATASATQSADQLQRQLMNMMRRYEQMGALPTSGAAPVTTATPAVSIAA
jgi:Ca2+-binding EF-hand superfamily protein